MMTLKELSSKFLGPAVGMEGVMGIQICTRHFLKIKRWFVAE